MSAITSVAERGSKALLKGVLLSLAKMIPSSSWATLVDQFAAQPRVDAKAFSYLERLINYLNRQRTVRQLGWDCHTGGQAGRYDIYDHVLVNHVTQPLDVLEFGVYRGASIRWFLSELTPECNVCGFDSFEGLPTQWRYGMPKGEFRVGAIPSITAPNLRFVKGWFEETLGPFLAATSLKPRLVLHMDADLYTPTIFVLRTMRDLLIEGTVLIFDEFWYVKDEW